MTENRKRSKEIAPDDKLWVCMMCGKTAVDPYAGKLGWDESCFIHSQLVAKDNLIYSPEGRVIQIYGDLPNWKDNLLGPHEIP